MFYPKIDTLFNRGEDFKVDTSSYRRPEFKMLNRWLVMEKLDGSNISIVSTSLNGGKTYWRGRTDRSQFIPDVTNHLNLRCETWHDQLQKSLAEHKLDSIAIFGEVYGPKIQNGGIYAKEIKTKFYDIRINNSLWLDHFTVQKYGEELGFELPKSGFNFTEDIVHYCRTGFETNETEGSGGTAEGIVAKTEYPLYTNKGDRLIYKLKHKDFK